MVKFLVTIGPTNVQGQGLLGWGCVWGLDGGGEGGNGSGQFGSGAAAAVAMAHTTPTTAMAVAVPSLIHLQ
jgi:hypothetical protein